MAALTSNYKALGQVNPVAGTLTPLYTVPANGSAVLSSVIVCNTTSSSVVFRLSHAIAGAADATAQYLYFDQPLNGNQTFIATVGFTMGPSDVLRCQSSGGAVAFNVYGSENT